MSVLADHVHGALEIREPDTRLHVYDAERDVVDCYDFGVHGRYPTSHFWDPTEGARPAALSSRALFSPSVTTTHIYIYISS